MSKKKVKEDETDKLTRIAIVKEDKCKPKKCRQVAHISSPYHAIPYQPMKSSILTPTNPFQECKRSCPVVKMGKQCVEVAPNSKLAYISEELCIGCGICVKKCPFEVSTIHMVYVFIVTSNTFRFLCSTTGNQYH